jgi:hypothetical protein
MTMTRQQLVRSYISSLIDPSNPDDGVNAITDLLLKTKADQKAQIQAWAASQVTQHQAQLSAIDTQSANAKTQLQQSVSDMQAASAQL